MATLREVKKRIKTVVSALLVLAIVLVSCSTALQAQTKFTLGPKIGLSLSSPYDSSWSEAHFVTGLSVGAFLNVRVSNQLSIQSEAHFVEKSPALRLFDILMRLKTSYLEMPVLAKWKISPNQNYPVSFFAGGAIALNLSATLPRNFGFFPEGGNYDFKDSVKDFDFGLVIGGELKIPSGSGNLAFELRYTHGLRSIIESSFFDNTKNRTFLVLVGYSLPLGT